jgi:2-polyprenyl-6-methoxyphenol hydroxylase-like FAD-dependent oxidoreductase/uncharacterized membrane protein
MAGVRSAIVVGAGIGGLTTAIALRRAGIELTVLERRVSPGRLLTGGGFMLWHNAFNALREIGLDRAVIERSSEIRFHEFRSDRGRRLARWEIEPHTRRLQTPAVALRRSVLNTVLIDELGEERVLLGAEVVDVEQDEDSATAVLADGTRRRADVLIGADGMRSSVRLCLRHGYDLPPRYARYTAWQAIADLPGEDIVPGGTFFNLWGRNGLRFLYCRLGDGEVYWDAITADRVSAGFDMIRNDKRHALAAAYQHWPEPVPQIIGATVEQAILPIAIHDRPPERYGSWGDGRVVLVGDAAHPQTLNLSQGAGQAIEDGVLLGRLRGDRRVRKTPPPEGRGDGPDGVADRPAGPYPQRPGVQSARRDDASLVQHSRPAQHLPADDGHEPVNGRLVVDALALVFLVAAGVLAGVLVGVDLAVVPMLGALPGEGYLQVHKLLDPSFDPFMPRLSKVTLVAGVALVVFAPGVPTKVTFALALLSIVGMAVVSEVFNVRMNRRIDTWSAERIPGDWQTVRATWGFWHRVRTVLSLAGFVAAAVASFLYA